MSRYQIRALLWANLAVVVLAAPLLIWTVSLWREIEGMHGLIATGGPSPETPPPPPPPSFALFRGNAERNLSAEGTIPRRPKLLWRFQTRTKLEGEFEQRGDPNLTPGHPWMGLGWTGQPVLLGNRIYFGSSDSYVYCLERDTGEVAWYYPTHHSVKGAISLFNDRIYHGGRDNKIHCYTLDGVMVWETRTGNDMDSNPVVVDGRGYIGGEDKRVYCFDPERGVILWKSELTEGSVESSPCVADGRVFVGSGRGKLYALDADTGKTLWTFATLGDTDSTPVHRQGRLYVGCATGNTGEKGHLWCVDAATGKERWHVPMARGIWASVALNPERGLLYVGANDGVFYAFRMEDGALAWKRKLGNRIWSSAAAVADGCILVAVRDGRVWCLDEETGEPLWVFDDGFDITATPLVADGLIVIGSQNGWVYAIGEAGEDEEINPHWFATTFPMKQRLDRKADGIVTIDNPAPPPKTYRDTAATYHTGLHRPVYGPAYDAETPPAQ